MTTESFLPNGCTAHPDCFTCPFPECVARASRSSGGIGVASEKLIRKLTRSRIDYSTRLKKKMLAAAAMSNAGLGINQVAQKLKIHRSTASKYVDGGLALKNRPLKDLDVTDTTPKPAVVAERGAQAQTARSRVLYESV